MDEFDSAREMTKVCPGGRKVEIDYEVAAKAYLGAEPPDGWWHGPEAWSEVLQETVESHVRPIVHAALSIEEDADE